MPRKESIIANAAAGWPRAAQAQEEAPMQRKGNIKHSVCQWCYNNVPFEELCAFAKEIGIEAMDLIKPADWPVLQKHGLICSMTPCNSIAKGLNRVENHDECLANIRKAIDATAEAGFPNVICFSGNRDGMSDDEGLRNCAAALKRIAPYAEEKGVTICMELLNSKINHKGYMCDHTAWGAALCEQVGSPRVKLLYDIYHMQIMEGDIVNTIRQFIRHIGHIHTGGVPGRAEIDETQELYYPAIMRAIVETGYKGYVAQEFKPKRDALPSLKQAIDICDV
ncbi:MAG: putative hydroxypyruvate isomerase YgbM [candidate division BRC1 bacterium ADurb.BinA364]|nr:MAG: putative hydroxypyruvate isomerase YgbM [candidate division BRC1 bacterium ADurb.BinA364]